jgi:1-acyl-sn-glycerol-3-phosphate acyltransferase
MTPPSRRTAGMPAVTLGMRLRSALYLAWLVLSVIPYALAVVGMSVFVRGRPLYHFCVGWLRGSVWGARAICGIEWRVQGMDNLPDGPLILCPKHQSAWETLALPLLMPRPLSYVFKRELLYVPFFGWALGRLDMVHIDRSRGTEAFGRVASQGAELLRKGYWVIMFPEGTRTARGSHSKYKVGGARLAELTGTPLLPIAITSGRCWPRQAFIKRPGLVEVSIGRPIDPRGRSAADVMAEAEAWIEAEMRRLDPEAYTAQDAT